MLPRVPSPVSRTPGGVPYLTAPGLALVGMPQVDLSGVADFLEGFDPELGFPAYLADPDPLPPGEQLVKAGGQLCYLSLGPQRTWNAKAQQYLEHILESGHGSVLEHANYTFWFWGISRSLSHELVRHRAGFAYSQLSQRYVDGKKLRFVERPEFQDGGPLHATFVAWIEQAAAEYDTRAAALLAKMAPTFPADMPKTERRKRVNQAARSVLPNEAETVIQVTANARSWRHFLEMRAASPAEVEIRVLAAHVHACLRQVAPLLFGDYLTEALPDGTTAVRTRFRKV